MGAIDFGRVSVVGFEGEVQTSHCGEIRDALWGSGLKV